MVSRPGADREPATARLTGEPSVRRAQAHRAVDLTSRRRAGRPRPLPRPRAAPARSPRSRLGIGLGGERRRRQVAGLERGALGVGVPPRPSHGRTIAWRRGDPPARHRRGGRLAQPVLLVRELGRALAAGDVRGQSAALLDGRLLLDCGPEVLRSAVPLRRLPRGCVRAVLVTHSAPRPRRVRPRCSSAPGPAAGSRSTWSARPRRSRCSATGSGRTTRSGGTSSARGDTLDLDGYVYVPGRHARRLDDRARPCSTTSPPPTAVGCCTRPTPARCRGDAPGGHRRARTTWCCWRTPSVTGSCTRPTTSTSRRSRRALAALRRLGAVVDVDRRRRRPPRAPQPADPGAGRQAGRLGRPGGPRRHGPDVAGVSLADGPGRRRRPTRPHPGPRRGSLGEVGVGRGAARRRAGGHVRRHRRRRPDDAEWANRVALHRARRPPAWDTVETTDLVRVLRDAAPAQPLLVDCVTALAHRGRRRVRGLGVVDPAAARPRARRPTGAPSWSPRGGRHRSRAVLVSNEVGSGVVPATASRTMVPRRVRRLNARLAAASDRVVLLVAGQAIDIKPETTRSEMTGVDLEALGESLQLPDEAAQEQARARQARLTKPAGASGGWRSCRSGSPACRAAARPGRSSAPASWSSPATTASPGRGVGLPARGDRRRWSPTSSPAAPRVNVLARQVGARSRVVDRGGRRRPAGGARLRRQGPAGHGDRSTRGPA